MGILSKIVNIHSSKKEAKELRQNADLYFGTNYKIIKESFSLIEKTANPEVYFPRWDTLMDHVNLLDLNLEKVGGSIEFYSPLAKRKLSLNKSRVNDLSKTLFDKRESIDALFLDRVLQALIKKIKKLKTEKAQLNNLNKTLAELSLYQKQLSTNNFKTFTENVENIKKVIKQR
ncbi:hypothetical protein FC84_GL001626 [Lapidilactobacillus dextrinicus DSM 20335]|uniref:Uncharacterized protein n=1 Tax=Lapidilactobacillus dextrinicus DSM 20335 TaxID=1423738 RepID=A0A0R2BJG3_9LACO|nr:hypothetical protein [Lapidilactobacillus dextrinicus]KRM79447.1 hypothetical protein FC84_GL001626 [Lapidilactobacillus dextrinicus DSM 20335]QFG46718.1 hypothetical protein LH506_04330 [Lapidilactobacillus dextrinicus]